MHCNPRHRTGWLAATLAAAFFLAACGGGTSLAPTPTAPLTAASLSGQVVEVDGETTALGGVAITLAETGQMALTAPDGTFDFGTVPTGSLSLAVAAPASATYVVLASGPGSEGSGMGDDVPGMDDDDGHHGMDDDGRHHDADEVEDGEDLDDDGMHLHRAENQEEIRVRVRVRDGEICEMQVSRSGHMEREVEVRMTRTEANTDPDMKGKVELESRDDRERFKVRVRDADADLVLEAVVIDLDGLEESIGTQTVDLDGEARWTLDTSDGARLPFGVSAVEDLLGYDVEVRDFDTETALLTATLPELPLEVGEHHGMDDDDDGEDDADDDSFGEETRMRARARLEAHEPGVEGYVEIRSRPMDGEEKFEMEAEHIGAGREVEFEIETGEGTGTYTRLRLRTANGDGEAECEFETDDGDQLPGGAQQVGELVRLRVRVRDAGTGDVILSGEVPELVIDE